MTDQKALKILFNTYWSSAGWKREQTVSSDDFTYAQAAGLMFPTTHLSHADLVTWLKTAFADSNLKNISNAFLVSLRTRQLELRSALGSFAIAKNFPNHAHQGQKFTCTICGTSSNPNQPYDLSRLNFERYKWGGVSHESPEYAAFDLQQFAKLDPVEPTGPDLELIRRLLEVIRQASPLARPRDLEKKLASVLKSNQAEREVLLQILAYCGILQPAGHPGYFQSYPEYIDRDFPPVSKIDWTYPICWWRGSAGLNQSAVEYYFPQLT